MPCYRKENRSRRKRETPKENEKNARSKSQQKYVNIPYKAVK